MRNAAKVNTIHPNVTLSQSKNAVPPTEPEPLFKPFEWVGGDKAGPDHYAMLSNIRDLAAGVALALQIVERSEILKESGLAPVVDGGDANCFTRMSIAAMDVITGCIDEHFGDLDEHFSDLHHEAAARSRATKEGGAQ